MKIAIMTQPLGGNYGGIMQAWALQQVLKHMGHEPVTIDRQPKAPSAAYKLARLGYRAALKAVGKRNAPINFERHFPIIFKNTQKFIENRIARSEPLLSTSALQKHFETINYDAVIVGSDQTWRPMYSPNILDYYLNFLNNDKIKKISYASSFGVDHWEYNEEQTQECQKLAEKLDAISVRETSGVELCSKYLRVSAELTLDPTLLLTSQDYLSRLNITITSKNPSKLFTYYLDSDINKNEVATRIAETLNLIPFTSQPSVKLSIGSHKNLDDYTFPKVENWIKAFNDAEFIVTDSFHGCVFSIIFNKPFLVFSNTERGGARFKSLLKLFDLEDRLIASQEDAQNKCLQCIDWYKVNRLLDSYKTSSLDFLRKNLEDVG